MFVYVQDVQWGDVQRSGICAVGDFIYSSPPATDAERRTKVEILFKSSIVKVKLGQKAE